MKQLLLITGISCVCFTQVFAGSTPNNVPSTQTPNANAQTADASGCNGDNCQQADKKDNKAMKMLLVANDTTMTPAPDQTDDQSKQATPGTPDSKPADSKMQPKILLIGGSQPSKAEETPGQKPTAPKADAKKADPESDNQPQTKILLIGGSSPSKTEETPGQKPAAPKADAKKAEAQAEEQAQQQPLVV